MNKPYVCVPSLFSLERNAIDVIPYVYVISLKPGFGIGIGTLNEPNTINKRVHKNQSVFIRAKFNRSRFTV